MDALLMDAALKFGCYKEEDYCPIGLKKGWSRHLDSVGAVCDRAYHKMAPINLIGYTVSYPIAG